VILPGIHSSVVGTGTSDQKVKQFQIAFAILEGLRDSPAQKSFSQENLGDLRELAQYILDKLDQPPEEPGRFEKLQRRLGFARGVGAFSFTPELLAANKRRLKGLTEGKPWLTEEERKRKGSTE
jgi:hypothetical protein